MTLILYRQAFVTAAILCMTFAGCSKGQQSSSTTTTTTADQTSPAASPQGSPSSDPTDSATSASTAAPAGLATTSVSYSDLNGTFGQKEITQLAALGVFGDAAGQFSPAKILSRREYVRWLFKANNAIWASDTNKLIHPAQGSDSSFSDIKTSDPDYQYIQGMQDSGISVGFPDKTFRPDQPVSREQALAIKAALDRGGVDNSYVITKTDQFGYYNLPDWKDKKTISPEFVGAIATGEWDDKGAANESGLHVNNITRTFGAIAMVKPKAPLTRGQAAILLWKIGPHTRGTKMETPRSAADALVAATAPSASP